MKFQKIECGIPRTLWKSSRFQAGWNDVHSPDPSHQIFRYLSDKIVHVASGRYYVRRPQGGYVSMSSKAHAVSTCAQWWPGERKVRVTAKEIKEFVGTEDRPGKMVTLEGVTALPVAEPVVEIHGSACLNEWCDQTIPPSLDDFTERAAEILLTWVNEALCAGEPIPLEQLLDVLITQREPSEFRYLMHWCSRARQRLGRYCDTAVWLHGESTEIGKNALAELMLRCLGDRVTKTVTEHDVKRGWTGGTKGRFFVQLDEWKLETLNAQEEYLKQLIGNPRNTLVERHVGETSGLNTAHVLITINNTEDVKWLKEQDRRITLIHTSDDMENARELADVVGRALKGEHSEIGPDELVGTWNALLCLIPLDLKMLRRPLMNERRAEVIAQNKHPVQVWLEEDGLLPRNRWLPASDAFERFKQWFQMRQGRETTFTGSGFGRKLASYRQLAERKKDGQGNMQYRIAPSEMVPTTNGKVLELKDRIRQVARP